MVTRSGVDDSPVEHCPKPPMAVVLYSFVLAGRPIQPFVTSKVERRVNRCSVLGSSLAAMFCGQSFQVDP